MKKQVQRRGWICLHYHSWHWGPIGSDWRCHQVSSLAHPSSGDINTLNGTVNLKGGVSSWATLVISRISHLKWFTSSSFKSTYFFSPVLSHLKLNMIWQLSLSIGSKYCWLNLKVWNNHSPLPGQKVLHPCCLQEFLFSYTEPLSILKYLWRTGEWQSLHSHIRSCH